MCDILCTATSILDARETWYNEINLMLQSINFALRATVSSTHGHSPGKLVFSEYMVTRFKQAVDWQKITAKCQLISDRSLLRENRGRITHQYRITNQVLIIKSANERSGQRTSGDQVTEGTYHITRMHRKGTVDIHRGAIIENISTYRLKPYAK